MLPGGRYLLLLGHMRRLRGFAYYRTHPLAHFEIVDGTVLPPWEREYGAYRLVDNLTRKSEDAAVARMIEALRAAGVAVVE